jgi:hypothetical protein
MSLLKKIIGFFTKKNTAKIDLATKIAERLVNGQGKCPIKFAKEFLKLCDKEKK